MSKAELITWLAGLPDDSPDLERVTAIRTGAAQEHTTPGRALNITSAAVRAGVSRSCLYRAIAAGTLSAFVPYAGGRQRIVEGELARWLSSRKGEV
jgi:predicted DNA-binding transcriptional regulator AlpA